MIQLFTIHGNALCSAPDSTKSTQQVFLAGAATDQAIDRGLQVIPKNEKGTAFSEGFLVPG